MVGTAYATDPAKIASREYQLSFLERTLLRSPKKTRVVCLPGADYEGLEAREVIEVYDRLGIPRRNITGIEADPKTAQRLRNANLGITIFEGTDQEFFQEEAHGKYDIISLDYTGQQTSGNVFALKAIGGRQLLRNTGVMLINHAGNREGKHMQLRYLYRLHRNRGDDSKTLSFIEDWENGLEELSGMELNEVRDAITCNVLTEMREALWSPYPNIRHDSALPRWMREGPIYERAVQRAREVYSAEKAKGNAGLEKSREIALASGIFSREELELNDKYPELLPPLMYSCLRAELAEAIREHVRLGERVGTGIVRANTQRLLDGEFTIDEIIEKAEGKKGLSLPMKAGLKMFKGMRKIYGGGKLPQEFLDGMRAEIEDKTVGELIEETKAAIPEFNLEGNWDQLIADAYVQIAIRGYEVRKMERYSYVSSKKTPMLMDMVAFERPSFGTNFLTDFIKVDYRTGKVKATIPSLELNKFFENLLEASEALPKFGSEFEPRVRIEPEQRHFEAAKEQREIAEAALGPEVDGWDVIGMLTAGVTSKRIAEVARNVPTWQKVAAFQISFNKGNIDDEALDELL